MVVVRNGRVLTSVRLKNGRTQFPGGHVEPCELCLTAAVRELREETGLRIDPARMVHICHAVPSVGYTGEHYLGCTFMVELKNDEVIPANPEPDKHTSWIWMEPTAFARQPAVLAGSLRSLRQVFAQFPSVFIPERQ